MEICSSQIARRVGIERQVKRIRLTQGFVAIIDDVDYDWVSGFSWHAVVTVDGYVYAKTAFRKGKRVWNIYMHRHIMQVYDPKVLVDHRDGNGLDNRRDNIRVCSSSQNNRNRRKTKVATSSLFKGVCRHKRDKTWQASIYLKGKIVFLGNFKLEEDAARAYDAMAVKYFGQFASLNFGGNKNG